MLGTKWWIKGWGHCRGSVGNKWTGFSFFDTNLSLEATLTYIRCLSLVKFRWAIWLLQLSYPGSVCLREIQSYWLTKTHPAVCAHSVAIGSEGCQAFIFPPIWGRHFDLYFFPFLQPDTDLEKSQTCLLTHIKRKTQPNVKKRHVWGGGGSSSDGQSTQLYTVTWVMYFDW